LFALLAFLISGCNLTVVRGAGSVVSETRPASNFTEVELVGAGDVILTQGSEEGLRVEAEENLMQYLRTEVRGHTLYLGLNDDQVNILLVPTRPIKYYVSLKTIEGLKLSGSGNFEARQLQADRLALGISGSGNIVIDALTAQSVETAISGSGRCQLGEGTAAEQRIRISGSGNYEGQQLAGQTVAVEITGSGKATVRAENSLEVRLAGSGDVRYYGTPQVTQRITGSGRVQAESQR
jgi:hypothetical protein